MSKNPQCLLFWLAELLKSLYKTGNNVTETISDTINPIDTETAWSKKRAPEIPLKKTKGINTEHVVKTDEINGRITSVVPRVTALVNLSPLSMYCVMLSITIMELSIIIPTPNIKPDSEIIFIDMLANMKKSRLITSETGILKAISKGLRGFFKKKNIIIIAKIQPIMRLCFRLVME